MNLQKMTEQSNRDDEIREFQELRDQWHIELPQKLYFTTTRVRLQAPVRARNSHAE